MAAADNLEQGFRSLPPAARPHVYWLWLNGYVHGPSAAAELSAMKEAGLGGVLLFDMGARGEKSALPPAGPAFLSRAWLEQLRSATERAKELGLQVDLSVISSWDMGGPWIEPRHACMALYSTETAVTGGRPVEVTLPFPPAEKAAPKGPDGKPAFWTDVAVLAVRNPRRLAGHEFVIRLDPDGVHELREVVLDNGQPNAPAELGATMTPVRDFSVAVSTRGTREADFTEVARGTLAASAGPGRFALPAGTLARYVRLVLLNGHDDTRPRWTLAEFEVHDARGRNVALAHHANQLNSGALLVRAPVPLTYNEWNVFKVQDGSATGAGSVFATAGQPPFDVPRRDDVIDVTPHVEREGRLRWTPPAGEWTILRYVCMNTGEQLKVPSPASGGLATDHLSVEATRAHMDHVLARLQETFGDLRRSGLKNLYLASYEVVGKVWSPGFAAEFQRRRGYALTRFLPAIFGARIDDQETTERFLFDYTKTLGEVLVDAYYRTAREIAHTAGLTIKSEAGGPGPPIHTPPVDALLANGAVDEIQGEFWPYWPTNDAIWVVKETAAAGHIYGRRVVHMEAFTSFHHWAEGPQDLKPAADRVFCEGGNHMVWHTWAHQTPDAGRPGWVYGAGTHLNRTVTWWPQAKPFIDYLARCSHLLQSGEFVADVLYYYGDGGSNFVTARKNDPALGPGYDYDVTNADVILHRLGVRDGRLTVPNGPSYAVLVMPERDDIHPAVLAKVEALVKAGATIVGPKPRRASGLEDFPASDERVRELAGRLWGDLNGAQKTSRAYGAGRIIWGQPPRHVLTEMALGPDFTANDALDFIHRRSPEGDFYFVRNKRAGPFSDRAVFRVKSKVPELWDPRTGEIAPAAVYREHAHGVEVPLRLAPHGSVFVVFRNAARRPAIASVTPDAEIKIADGGTWLRAERPGKYEVVHTDGRRESVVVARVPSPLELGGNWLVEFDPGGGATPQRVPFPRLTSWAENEAAVIRYFSGTATYRKTFTLPPEWRTAGQDIDLDLGQLWTIGEVTLNGRALGVMWTAPFRVACTDALREGENELIVKVTNTWHNRLVGDAALEPAQRTTRTNIAISQRRPWAKLPPIPSGLFGPVRLVAVASRQLEH